MTVVVAVLLALLAAVQLLSAVGVLVMKDPYQRLHFIAPPATIGVVLLLAAVVIADPEPQSWGKTLMVVAMIALMNGVLTHATARAAFVRERGAWPPPEGSGIGIVAAEGTRPPEGSA